MSANRRVGIEVFTSSGNTKAELDSIKAQIGTLGPTAQASGGTASAAINGVATSAKGAATAINGSGIAIAAYDKEIVHARADLAQLNQRLVEASNSFGRNSQQAQALRAQLTQMSAATRGLVAEKALLVAEEKAVQVAQTNVTTGANSLTAALGRKTNQVRTTGTIFQGYDAILTVAGAATGGLTVGTSILITMLGGLAGALLGNSRAVEENVKANDALIASDIALQRVKIGLTEAANVEADAILLLSSYSDAHKKVEAATRTSEQALNNLIKTQIQGSQVMVRSGDAMNGEMVIRDNTAMMIRVYRDEVANANRTRQEEEARLKETVESLLQYQRATNSSTDSIIRQAQSIGLEARALDDLRAKLDAVTQARLAFDEALQSQKRPGFDTEATMTGINRLAADVARNIQGAIASGASFRDAVLSQSGPLKTIQQGLQEHTLSIAGYRVELAKLPDEIQRGIPELDKINKGMRAFADNTKEAERAAKALANTTAQLARELALSRLEGASFELREARIRKEFDFKKQELARENKLTTENEAVLNEQQLVAFRKLYADKQKVYDGFQDRIEAEQVKAIADESTRRRAELERQVKDFRQAAIDAGLSEQEMAFSVTRYRRQLETQFLNWRTEERAKAAKRDADLEAKFLDMLLDRVKKVNDETRRIIEAEQRARERNREDLQSSFGRPGRDVDPAQLREAVNLMQQLGMSARDVDSFFGSASISLDQFTERLRILSGANLGVIDTFRQLIDTQQLLVDMLNIVVQGISGVVAGTEGWGRQMLASFLMAIAGIAQMLGTLFILAAAGFAWIPGLQWTSTQLAIAGAAMLAFAGVLGGLASRITSSGREGSAAAGTAGGGAGDVGGGGERRQGRGPQEFDISGGGGLDRVFAQQRAFAAQDSRLARIDAQILRWQSVMDRSGFILTDAIAQRNIDNLQAQRAGLTGQGFGGGRVIPSSGGGATVINVTVVYDKDGTKQKLDEQFEKGVVKHKVLTPHNIGESNLAVKTIKNIASR